MLEKDFGKDSLFLVGYVGRLAVSSVPLRSSDASAHLLLQRGMDSGRVRAQRMARDYAAQVQRL